MTVFYINIHEGMPSMIRNPVQYQTKLTPSSAALAEGSRADCIQTISPRVQVSTRVRTCIPYWRALSGGRCRGQNLSERLL